MTDPTTPDSLANVESLITGHPELREALARLGDLDSVPVAEHHERLAHAHEMLHAVLDEPRQDA